VRGLLELLGIKLGHDLAVYVEEINERVIITALPIIIVRHGHNFVAEGVEGRCHY